jgi:hypothetical protein
MNAEGAVGLNRTDELHFENKLANMQSAEIKELSACVMLLLLFMICVAGLNCFSTSTQKVADENEGFYDEETQPLTSDSSNICIDSQNFGKGLVIDYSVEEPRQLLQPDDIHTDMRAVALAASDSLEVHRQALASAALGVEGQMSRGYGGRSRGRGRGRRQGRGRGGQNKFQSKKTEQKLNWDFHVGTLENELAGKAVQLPDEIVGGASGGSIDQLARHQAPAKVGKFVF